MVIRYRYEISEDKHKLEVDALNQSCSQYQDYIRELTAKVNSLQLMEQELFTAKMMINVCGVMLLIFNALWMILAAFGAREESLQQ